MPRDNLDVRVRLLESKSAQVEAKRTAAAIGRIGGAARHSGTQARQGASGIEVFHKSSERLRHTMELVGGATGLGGIAFGMKQAVQGAITLQSKQAQLRAALTATGQASARSVKAITDAAETSSMHGGFDATEQLGGITQLVRRTGDYTKAIRLNQLAMKIARGSNGQIGYAQAIRLVSTAQGVSLGRLRALLPTYKATSSHVTAVRDALARSNESLRTQVELWRIAHPHVRLVGSYLQRMNPQVLAAAKAQDAHANSTRINTLIQRSYGNAITAYSHTTAGSLSDAKNAFGAASEQLGTTFLPYITSAATWLARIGTEFTRNWPRYRREIRPVVQEVRNLVTQIVSFVRQHPWILRVAAALAAVGLAARAVSFAGSITGVTNLLRLLGVLGRTRAGEEAASGIAGGLRRGLPGRMGPVGRLLGSTLGAAAAPVLATYLAREAQKYFGKGIANVLGGPTDVAAAEAKNKMLQKGRQMLDSAALIPALKRWGVAHPKLDAQAHRDIAHGGYSQRTVAELVRANYPGLIPGAEGVPKDYQAAVGLRHQAVHAVAGRQSGRHAGASSVRASHDTQPIHITNVIKLNDRVLAEEIMHYQLRMGARR